MKNRGCHLRALTVYAAIAPMPIPPWTIIIALIRNRLEEKGKCPAEDDRDVIIE